MVAAAWTRQQQIHDGTREIPKDDGKWRWSGGTDHGTAGCVFAAGTRIRAGLIGQHPSLEDLVGGDLKHHTDFRQVYAIVLQQWMRVPSKHALLGEFSTVPLFA